MRRMKFKFQVVTEITFVINKQLIINKYLSQGGLAMFELLRPLLGSCLKSTPKGSTTIALFTRSQPVFDELLCLPQWKLMFVY